MMATPSTHFRTALRFFGLFVICFLGFATLEAQQFTYKLTCIPDSADVTLNGVSIGKTPMVAKVDWSQRTAEGFVFSFSHMGYQTGTYAVTEKPKYKENFKDMKLVKITPHFEMDANSVLVDFDKVMAEFPIGKIIGNNKTFYGGEIKWEAYSRVGVDAFSTMANDLLGTAGFRTPKIVANELFRDTSEVLTPRYLVGGRVTDIWVELGPTTIIGIRAKNRCTIEWKVFDKLQNKVVLTETTVGEYEGKYESPTELNIMMDLFKDSLENFLFQGKLADLVKAAGPR